MTENDAQFSPLQPVDYPDDYDPSLNGIRGWMVIIVIGRILTLLYGAYSNINGLMTFVSYHVSDFVLYLMLVIDTLNTVGLSVVMLVLIFKRNILFRTLFVIQFSALIIETIIIGIYVSKVYNAPLDPSDYVGLIGGVVWAIYLFVSKRVKNTFIYNRLYTAPASAAGQR
jgi:hypothetical protein